MDPEAKQILIRYLGPNWRELADGMKVAPHLVARFDKGHEAAALWDHLYLRGRLSELPGLLRAIERADLAVRITNAQLEVPTAAAHDRSARPRSRVMAVGVAVVVLLTLSADRGGPRPRPGLVPPSPDLTTSGPPATSPGVTPTAAADATSSPGTTMDLPTTQDDGPAVFGFVRIYNEKEPIDQPRSVALPGGTNGEANWTRGSWPTDRHPVSTHTGTGRHSLELPAIGAAGGVVQVAVMDFADSGNWCQTTGWRRVDASEHVEVLCFDQAGRIVDQRFSMLFLAGRVTSGYSLGDYRGYVSADQPTKPQYTPSIRRHAGPIHRDSVGRYTVTVERRPTTVQVTPVSDQPRHCGLSTRTSTTVTIACFDQQFKPIDAAFALSYTDHKSPLDDSRYRHATTLTVEVDAAGVPIRSDPWSSMSGPISVTSPSAGHFIVDLPTGELGSYSHVTPHGPGYCNLTNINDASPKHAGQIWVTCYDENGKRNLGFDLTYLTRST